MFLTISNSIFMHCFLTFESQKLCFYKHIFVQVLMYDIEKVAWKLQHLKNALTLPQDDFCLCQKSIDVLNGMGWFFCGAAGSYDFYLMQLFWFSIFICCLLQLTIEETPYRLICSLSLMMPSRPVVGPPHHRRLLMHNPCSQMSPHLKLSFFHLSVSTSLLYL